MLHQIPPIFVEHVLSRPTKRRRLEGLAEHENNAQTCDEWQLAESRYDADSAVANLSTEVSTCADAEDYDEPRDDEALVCFGMVSVLDTTWELPLTFQDHQTTCGYRFQPRLKRQSRLEKGLFRLSPQPLQLP